MNIRKSIEDLGESDKRVDYLKHINTLGIGLIAVFSGFTSLDTREIRAAQQVQAVEIMRLDTNQKTVVKSIEVLNTSDKARQEEINKMKIEWIQALNELKDRIKK